LEIGRRPVALDWRGQPDMAGLEAAKKLVIMEGGGSGDKKKSKTMVRHTGEAWYQKRAREGKKTNARLWGSGRSEV